jgi:large repetitive protein
MTARQSHRSAYRWLLAVILVFAASVPAAAQTTSYSLLVSASANRSAPAPLQGANLSGNVYIFTSPDTSSISEVRFWLDNPNHTGAPRRTEGNGPYDFNGGTVSTANPFNVSNLSSGTHSVTAEIVLTTGGSQFITGTFSVGTVP